MKVAATNTSPAPAVERADDGTETSRIFRTRLRAFLWGRSLAECIESGRDNILQVRLVAALLVIYGHSVLTGGSAGWIDLAHWVVPDLYTHVLGLFTFFLLSGILVTLSYIRTPHLVRFLRARFLRIWPALAVCALVWAFVLGPLLTEVPLATYFSMHGADSPYDYAAHILSIFRISNALPGVFTHNWVAGQVNTPLWTIAVESTLYLWVAGAGVLRLLRLPWLTSFAIAGLFSYLVLWPMSRGQFELLGQLRLTVEGFFGAGVILCLLRRYVRVSSGIMLAIGIACGLASRTTHHMPFALLATGYAVLWIAYVPRLPEMPFRADFSYGTYLWGWPVQQTVLMLTHVKSPTALFAIAAPIAVAIGALSWFCIEKPALRLKDRRIVFPAWMRRLVAKPPPEPVSQPS